MAMLLMPVRNVPKSLVWLGTAPLNIRFQCADMNGAGQLTAPLPASTIPLGPATSTKHERVADGQEPGDEADIKKRKFIE